MDFTGNLQSVATKPTSSLIAMSSSQSASALSRREREKHRDVIANQRTSIPTALVMMPRARSAAPSDDDVSPCALDDSHDLGPLGRRDCELVERLRHVVHERVPLARTDAQVPVRALHVLASVFLRTSGGPAQHFGN